MALWRHYIPTIASGAPFYLAADGRLIRELYATKLGDKGGTDTALRDFHESCRSLLDTTGTRTVVCDIALRPIPGEVHSRAICLAVQQVLVVEQMLNDVQYSEHSYFPRYREVLCLSDHREHANPIASAAFQEIWNVLAGEIRAVPGAGEPAVTFVAGKGRDLNRSFPLSQALFTAHDLTIIRAECQSIDERTVPKVLLTALLRVRGQLGGRARKLLAAAATDEVVANRLCEQVRSFLANDVLSSLRSRILTATTGVIVAYLERADPFDIDSDEDRFSVHYQAVLERPAGAGVEEAVALRLAASQVVFLVPDADGFREWSREASVDGTDSVLAIVEASKAYLLKAQVAQLHGASFVTVKSNLGERFTLLVCDSGIGSHITSLLGLREPARRIELVGGLLADARSQVFLAGYSPTGIYYDDRLLAGEDGVVVDGVHRHVGEFLEALRSQSDGARYTVQIGEAALSLAVSSRKQSSSPATPLGYLVNDGELDLVARPVATDQPNLRGTLFANCFSGRPAKLSTHDIAMLMHRGRRLAVCEADLASLLAELRLFEPANGLASVAARQIASTRSVPLKAATSGLLRRLESARGQFAENRMPDNDKRRDDAS